MQWFHFTFGQMSGLFIWAVSYNTTMHIVTSDMICHSVFYTELCNIKLSLLFKMAWCEADKWILAGISAGIGCWEREMTKRQEQKSETWGKLFMRCISSSFTIQYCLMKRSNSQIPQCTCHISHNATFRTELCTFLFWMVQCVIWDRCIMGFVRLVSHLSLLTTKK